MSEIPDLLLQVWKLVLLGFMYLFFFRVLRAVWANLRASTERPQPVAAAAVPAQVQRQHDQLSKDTKGVNTLKVLEPANAKGTVFTIGSNELTMGRGSGCAILLSDDTFVSTLHARVFRRDGQVFLEDLGSTNGTLHNGKKVSSAIPLKKGDRISVGRTVLEAQR